jgi:hypothetical protein
MTAIVGVLVLVLSACGGNETGPAPTNPTQEPGPDPLVLKVDALSVDQCFLVPEQQQPKGCEKYVTQLGNTAAMVRDRAGSTDVRLATLADQLDKAVSAYRGNACDTVVTAGPGPCTQALSDISSSLQAIKTRVDNQATTG